MSFTERQVLKETHEDFNIRRSSKVWKNYFLSPVCPLHMSTSVRLRPSAPVSLSAPDHLHHGLYTPPPVALPRPISVWVSLHHPRLSALVRLGHGSRRLSAPSFFMSLLVFLHLSIVVFLPVSFFTSLLSFYPDPHCISTLSIAVHLRSSSLNHSPNLFLSSMYIYLYN